MLQIATRAVAGLGLTCLLVAAFGGCTRESDATGVITMQLRTDAGGNSYRLRSATFNVLQAGATVAAIDTETDPTATSVQQALAAGSYTVNLTAGWRLEKLIGGSFQTVSAQLVSANPVPVTITSGQTTPVAYAFQTDGTVVVVGDGTLDLTIQVTDTSAPTAGIWNQSSWNAALWN
jgi:hypothetical protein